MPVIQIMQNVLLRGYFGHGNWGDEILLRALVTGLTMHGVPFDRLHYWRGSDQFYRPAAIAHSAPRRVRGMAAWAGAGAVVFCGGIFYDHLPDVNLQRLQRIFYLAGATRALGKKVMMLGVSIGPLISRQGRLLTSKILKLADAIWVRDRQSYRFCRESNLRCRQIPDLSALLFSHITAMPPSTGRRELLFIPCQTGLTHRKHVEILDALMPVARQYGLIIRLLPIHLNADAVLTHRLSEQYGFEVVSDLFSDPMDLFTKIMDAELVVSTRLHGGWAAYLAGRPFLQINYHPKCRGFAETIHLPSECLIDPLADTINVKNGADRWFASGENLYNTLIQPKMLENEVNTAMAMAARQLSP